MAALEKAGFDYRPPRQTRHSFATMMISAGEELGWVQHMLGHSSLQMIFQKYYIWIPKSTRSDGKAFERFVGQPDENRTEKTADTESVSGRETGQKSGKKCTKIVRLADFRQRKRA
jgi:integrase